MQIDFSKIDARTRYKMMTGSIIPRPIAWVNTVNEDGSINTAPFSFFNGVSDEPPAVMVSIGDKTSGGEKDTLINIRRQREFVVNMCDEETVEAMSFTAGDFPYGFEEARTWGLHFVDSVNVAVPRLKEAPVAFECKLLQLVRVGLYTMVIGEIVSMFVRDDLCVDDYKIHFGRYRAVGRLAGSGYAYIRDLFAVDRATYRGWLDNPEAEKQRIRIRPLRLPGNQETKR